MNTLKYNTTAIYFLLSNLLSTIIYVLTLCRSESSLEIGDAVLSKNVVPLEELLDIAVVNTVAIVVRKNLSKISVELSNRRLLVVESARLALFLLAYAVEHYPEWHLISVCIHSDVTKACYAVGSESWDTLVSLIECFYDEVSVTS